MFLPGQGAGSPNQATIPPTMSPPQEKLRSPRTIVVAQLAFIGDMVFSTPLLRALVQRWPEAFLVVVGRPGAVEVLEDFPGLGERIAYDKEGSDAGPGGIWRLSRVLRGLRPDWFLGVSRSGRTALLGLLSGSSLRAGFSGGWRSWAYTHPIPRDDAERTFPERPLALLEALGFPANPQPLELGVSMPRRKAAGEALRQAGWQGEPLLAIAPGAHFPTKRWPERHVARFLDLVLGGGLFRPALYGGPEEEALIDRLLSGRPQVLDRRGIGIRGVAAELTWAAAFVGGDSGPAHIARALGTPAVILHGPTDPRPLADSRPYPGISLGLPCQPCSPRGHEVCPLGHHACLEEMGPERVLGVLLERARWDIRT